MAKSKFIRKSLEILRFLVENWEIIVPILIEIIEESKEQDYKPKI